MANFTPNVNLEKPLGSEHYLIPNFNANMDKIDAKFGEVAPKDSPELTGVPIAPTALTGTNTNQIATTAFVKAVIAALVDSSPSTLDTLNELAQALGDDPNFATTMAAELGNKAIKPTNEAGASSNSILVSNGDGSSIFKNQGSVISDTLEKSTPADNDMIGLMDSGASNVFKKLSWANIKATLKTYFDGVYATISNLNLKAPLANPVFTGLITTGGQIKFPATQVPSSDPNTIDDYKEGSWTPNASTWTTSPTLMASSYIKVGKSVQIAALFLGGVVQNFGEISGLPFNVGGHGICHYRRVSSTAGGTFGLFDTAVPTKISSIAGLTFTDEYWLLTGTYISNT